MKLWTLQEAKSNFERGLILRMRLVNSDEGWMIEFDSALKRDGVGYLGYSLREKIGKPRTFVKVTAAIDVIYEIGSEIKTLTVN